MLDDWKKAWKEAVENFQRELEGDEGESPPAQIAAMRRDLNAAREALDRLKLDAQRTRTELAEEEKQEQICRRRGEMAAGIADQETVRIALQWAERHEQRAIILRQKVEVLDRELAMRTEDMQGMEAQFEQTRATLAGTPSPGTPPGNTAPRQPRAERTKADADFRRLERDAREKAAEARLEELKKKMR